MVIYRQNLHTGCKKTKKRLNMKEANSIWGVRDNIDSVQSDAIGKLEKLACKSGFKILLIEDDLIQLSMLRELLKEECFVNVIVSNSAEDAIGHIIKNNKISLILSDYRMEGDLTGYDVFKATKKFKLRPMFVVMSGYVPSEVLNLKKEGLLFLPKPYNVDNLISIVNKVYVKYLEHNIKEELT